jgi:hypothetical protein
VNPGAAVALAALAALAAMLAAPPAHAATPLPPFERAELSRVPRDTCQELRVARAGEGHLEVRFFASTPLERTGPDPKVEGASLLLPGDDPERATLVAWDASGPYARSARVPAPWRWVVRDGRLCVASGADPVLCAAVATEPTRFVQIAFGPGWETDVVGCSTVARPAPARGAPTWGALLVAAAAAAVGLARGARARSVAVAAAAAGAPAVLAHLHPFAPLGPTGAAVSGLVGAVVLAGALAARRAHGRARLAFAALGLVTALAAVTAPHPVATPSPAPPAVPPLFTDAAFWHPRGPHQSLAFRGRPVAGVEASREVWLVLGGSVAFGEGVEADETFTAVAEARLRASGRDLDLDNAGAQGWNLAAIDRWLRDMGDALPVDGLVLVSILNNATLPIPGPRAAGCDASLLRAFACNRWRSLFFLTWPKVFAPEPHNPERHAARLRGLLERETALGRRIVLMDEPSAAQIHGGRFRWFGAEAYRAATRAIGADFGLALHPVADVLAALPADEAFFDGLHPTPAAHRLWGERLAEVLADEP